MIDVFLFQAIVELQDMLGLTPVICKTTREFD